MGFTVSFMTFVVTLSGSTMMHSFAFAAWYKYFLVCLETLLQDKVILNSLVFVLPHCHHTAVLFSACIRILLTCEHFVNINILILDYQFICFPHLWWLGKIDK